MKRLLFIIFLIFCLFTVKGQNQINQILLDVESNNTTLKALKEKANADKIGNKTGLNMANPEISVGRLWASPRTESDETDLSINQSFDFPTAYRYKSQLAKEKNKQVDLAYEQERVDILQQARAFCVELVYQAKLSRQLKDRLDHARDLSTGYQKMFDRGEIDILERNKTRLNLLTVEKAFQINEVEIRTLKSELKRLNGGIEISFVPDAYLPYTFPLSFDEWFVSVKENNPELLQARQEIVMSRKQEQLTRALNLPKFTAGYSNEKVGGVTSQGFVIGMSIPLWEGRNTVKHQKAQTIALQIQHDDFRLQFQNKLYNQYEKAVKYSILLQEYKDVLDVTSDYTLLKKAFDKGQLSLINYLLELSAYYDTTDKYLETERDYQLSVSELQQWEK